MTTHVLVPMDGSPLSFSALRYALQSFPDATVTVLHVVDLFEPGYGAGSDSDTTYEPLMGTDAWYERADEVTEQLFEEARDVADEYDREVDTTSDIGEPARVIVDYVEDEDVDHVVIGVHGRSDETRPVFGSVTELVARRVPVPVTIIR